MSELCRRYEISRTTGYKWLSREGLEDLSRRPLRSPGRTPAALEAIVLEEAARHPFWGARKLRRCLADKGIAGLPAPSTLIQILKRNGVSRQSQAPAGPFVRFEREAPNDLWQMDFKGHFAMKEGRCHPLTLLDDHSRFALCVQACERQDTQTVQPALVRVFQRYGLPWAILCDNGAPWGTAGQQGPTRLEVWLLQHGVQVWHGRPLHPQTQGKLERFHRTLQFEALGLRTFANLGQCQKAFDVFRADYNLVRPHDALNLDTPASHYRPSPREFRERVAQPEYPENMAVRKVSSCDNLRYLGYQFRVSNSLRSQTVGLKRIDDYFVEVYFYNRKVATYDLRDHKKL